MNQTLTLCKTVLHLHKMWVKIMLIASILIIIIVVFLPEEKQIKKDIQKDIPLIINQVDSLETNKSIVILDSSQNPISFLDSSQLIQLAKSGNPIKVEIMPSKKFDWKGITTFIISAINGIIIFILNIRKFFAKKLQFKKVNK